MADRLTVIVNPFGGKGNGIRIWDEARSRLKRKFKNLEVYFTERPGHACELASSVPLGANEVLLSIGGDGTLHEVINGIMARDKPARPILATLPAGSGNAFAEDIGFIDVDTALQRVAEGNIRYLDLMHVQIDGASSYAFNIVGWGLPGDVGHMATRLRWMGSGRYTWASLISLVRRRIRKAALFVDDKRYDEDYVFVLASNTRFTGKGMKMAPRAKLDDGLIDLLVVPSTGRLKLLSLFHKIYDGSHVNSSILRYDMVSGFELESTIESYINIDGEVIRAKSLKVNVDKRPLQFVA